ncbi:MAG: AAA family ATPase [Clostridia bacterium]|nr:AAA family ATPase [Clostridia bacterium]
MNTNAITFNLYEIDKNLQVQNGDLIAICGRPAIGKTALALTLIFNNLDGADDKRCLLVSFDAGNTELTAKFDAFFMEKKPNFNEDYLPCAGIINWLFEERLIIETTVLTPVNKLCQLIKKLAKANKIDFVVIDYLQLMIGSKKHNTHQEEIHEIVSTLKETAKDTNLPIIITSQVPRLNTEATPKNIFPNNDFSSIIDKFIILQDLITEEPLSNSNIPPVDIDIYNNKSSAISTQIGFNTTTFKFVNI